MTNMVLCLQGGVEGRQQLAAWSTKAHNEAFESVGWHLGATDCLIEFKKVLASCLR